MPKAETSDPSQPSQRTDLTIAVIHYRTPDVLSECLRRIRKAAPAVRVFVVDTGGGKTLPSGWREAGVELIAVANHSYAHAVNEALKRCETPFLAVMNADVFVEDETLTNLLWGLRDPTVAATGPTVRDGEGRLQDQGWPYRVYQWWLLQGKTGVDVPWLSACIQVVRLEAVIGRPAGEALEDACATTVAAGGMDASLRFYNEDMEWGWRMRQAGWKCRMVATPVVHLGGNATPPDVDAFMVEGLRGGYVLSQRSKPWWYRRGHRSAVMLWAALQERFGDPGHTRAFRAIRTMFARNRFAESPFGATLAEENPAFWNEMT